LKKIPLIEPFIHASVEIGISDFLLKRNRFTSGVFHELFEDSLKYFLKFSGSIQLTSSGTSALHLALLLENVGVNDVVFCANSTFIASVNPICYVGAKPWFVDVDSISGNMNPQYLEEAITSCVEQGMNPKCVVVTHSYGYPCDMNSIIRICKAHNIVLIEDAAEALGSIYKNNFCGTLGDYGVISFNANKINTTFGGGVLLSRKGFDKEKALKLITQNKKHPHEFIHDKLGYNYRMNDLAAYFGYEQIKFLIEELSLKKNINKEYLTLLQGQSSIKLFQKELFKDVLSNRWMNVAQFNSEKELENAVNVFRRNQIDFRKFWFPLNKQKYLKEYRYSGNDESMELYNTCLCIPSSSHINNDEIKKVAQALMESNEL